MATSTASVTTDTTNYTRIHLILMKGGTLLTKTLFLKRVKDLSPAGHEFTVDEFLGKHRVQILSTSTGRNNEEKLYPPTGTSTNLDEWDLPLYCFILKTVCGLPNINKLDMEILKTMRNELAHLHDPSLTDADFKSHLITIEPIFARSFHMINDPSFEKELKALLQKCETGALVVDEVVKVHHDSNRKHIELLSNQVKMMKTQVDMIKNQSVMLQNQTTHQEKIDSALSMLTEIKDRLPPNPDVDIPDVHVIIEVKNCTKEKEKELLDFLVKQFDETISDPECTLNKDFPNLAMYTISEAICKTFQSFLEKGRHLLKVENGSICLTVKCNSISSFVGLIRDYIDGKLLDHLTDLKDAIQKWDGFSYIDFDLIVSPDEITEAILKLAKNLDEIVPKGIQVNVPPDELSSSTMFDPSTSKEDTLTSCSTSSIFRLEIKPETDDQRTEIEKCFSSGSISERFEQCQRQLRKDPHFTNVEIEAKLLAVDSPRTGSKRPHEDEDDESEIDEDKLLEENNEIEKELEKLSSQIDHVVLSDEEEGETSTPKKKRGLELREYQKELASVAVRGENTVIYAATGAGKTRVAFYVVKKHLEKHPTGKVALMADKTYLVKQHEFALKAFLPEYEKITLRVSGEQENSTNIHLLLDKYNIFILTPALIENTMKRHDPEFLCKFSLLIFDECHHTKGRSTYNRLMTSYHMLKEKGKSPLPQIVGLTATFGTNKANTVERAAKHLLTVMANLDVTEISSVSKNNEEYEKFRNDVKTAKHVLPDVNKNDRVYKCVVNAMKLTEDIVCATSDKLDRTSEDKEKNGLITVLNKRDTWKMGEEAYITWIGDLENSAAALYGKRGEIATVVSMGAKYLKVYHEVLEINYQLTSDYAAKALVQKLEDAGFGKSSTSTEEVEITFAKIAQDLETELTNMPKYRHEMDEKPIGMLLKILNEKKSMNPKFIVMVQKREIAGMLTRLLKEEGYKVETFTGSSATVDVGGTSKTEQESAVKQFRDGTIEGLIATNILEEGLDIPECNLMIPYLYVGNEISTRQTAGRIRATKGEKILLSDAKKHLRESLNVQRGALMDEAMKSVLGMSRDERNKYIINEQKAIIRKEQQQLQQEKSAAKRVKLDNSKYKMVCVKCSNFSVNCSSLRCINGQHHAIIDPAIWPQVTTKPFPKKAPKFDEDLDCQGRLFGSGMNKCTHELGTVMKFREVPLPFLSYKMVCVIDTDTGKSFKLGKWSDAPFSIETIVEPDDLDVMATVSPNLTNQKPTT